MTTALTERPVAVPSVTAEQLELVKKTVAAGATADELKLYLYDCARQNVHPLDKLIHFTKRSGKYTPITSIDFMRIRAADTGEYAGSDDALFVQGESDKEPVYSATVTVWRLVQGTRCSFTATARWPEYKPAENDFMWKKMPHTMLGKCAEALALRKGFPKQLAGLYAKEEMDQAGPSQPTANVVTVTPSEPMNTKTGEVLTEAVSDLPKGTVLIIGVTSSPTRKANITKFTLELSDGRKVGTIKEQVGKLAEQACQSNAPVYIDTKPTQWGEDVLTLTLHKPLIPAVKSHEPPLAVYDDVPF